MIFYPIDFWGLPLKRWVLGSLYDCDILQPLGLIGWQVAAPHPWPNQPTSCCCTPCVGDGFHGRAMHLCSVGRVSGG